MFQTIQALHPVPTVFGAGFIAPRFENGAPSKLVDDGQSLFKKFAERLHALVWSEQTATRQRAIGSQL
jgi:hypothetical protein